MKKNNLVTIMAILGCVAAAKADVITVNQVGVGARALSMADNYVAAANDMSSLYWNPAALSFMPVREFQVAADMLTNSSSTDFFGTNEASSVRRMRLADVGYLTSLPTSRGGLTFGASLQNPFIFDNNPSFRGQYTDTSNNPVKDEDTSRGYGSLNYWTGAFGVQVAPGLGLGAALSLVTGNEKIKHSFLKLTSGFVADSIYDNYIDTKERDYFGYDLRLGLMYALPGNLVRFGARLVLPQTIWFDESSSFSGDYKGQLYSSFNGAIGVAGNLPFMTLSTEFRFRAPYDYMSPDEAIPTNSPAHQLKVGAGIGAEIPLFKSNFLARLGYSWDQYDLYQFAMKYDGEATGSEYFQDQTGWGAAGYSVVNDKQLFTAGLAYVSGNVSIEAAYANQSWKLTAFNGVRNDNDRLQRVLVSLSIRY
jgi:long-subunit fatty acid transport protein